MSGSRTKALRRECEKRLGHAPFEADGHVTIRWTRLEGIGHRVLAFFKKPAKTQADEFRFFKRHGKTIQEAALERGQYSARVERHKREVEESNVRIATARLERAKKEAA